MHPRPCGFSGVGSVKGRTAIVVRDQLALAQPRRASWKRDASRAALIVYRTVPGLLTWTVVMLRTATTFIVPRIAST